jgi:lipopolysaccharide export system permease protein
LIILKYIRKELVFTIITITSLLILIGMSNQIAIILEKAVHGELAKSAVLYIVAFSFPYFIAMLTPIGVFIAVYLVFTRLYSEQEMIILKMSGFSNLDLLKIIALPLVFISLFTAFANLWFVPTVLRYRDILMDKAGIVDAVTMLAAGHFQVVAGGRYVIYVQDTDSDAKSLKNIFVAEQPLSIAEAEGTHKNRWDIFISQEGREQTFSEFGDKRFVVMKNGYQYQGLPGKNDFMRMKFTEYGFEIPQQTIKGKLRRRAKSSAELWASSELADQAELQARINLIVSPIVLSLLAVAMSRLKPRQSRFAKLFPAIILVLIYYNLMLASDDWLARGTIPMFLGAWWLHLTTAGLACYSLFKEK